MKVRLQRLAADLALPEKASIGSSGLDLRAHIPSPIILAAGQRQLVPTGLRLEIPTGYEAQVRPRSGLALRHGITVLNSPGTIDADYRGEVGVVLINLGQEAFTVERGQRIAQLVFAKVEEVEWEVVEALDDSDRGDGGFGSTGS